MNFGYFVERLWIFGGYVRVGNISIAVFEVRERRRHRGDNRGLALGIQKFVELILDLQVLDLLVFGVPLDLCVFEVLQKTVGFAIVVDVSLYAGGRNPPWFFFE